MPDTEVFAVVVLAAGAGTRMRSATPKVLHTLAGRSMLGHVLAAAAPVGARHTMVIVGHGADDVRAHLAEIAPLALVAVQDEQNGSGHAAAVAMAALPGRDSGGGDDDDDVVLILNGDAPLLTAATVEAFAAAHRAAGAMLSVLSADVADPTGLGRVVRATDGSLRAIVEQADADPATLAVTEVNAGVYAVGVVALRDALARLSTDNAKGEQYLTDIVGLLVADGLAVRAHVAADPADTLGCNDRVELAARRRTLNDRLLAGWMRGGVTVVDPATTWVDIDVRLAPDVTLHPGVQLCGVTTVAAGAEIGPDSTLRDTVVGPGARIVRTHAEGAVVGDGVSVGPFAYLRPGTRLDAGAKVGTFVETKNAHVGAGAKVPHLSYVGDATIGEGTNIGAATVFVNYDGVDKHHTTIGRHARTGADNMFVAPVHVGDGAYTAAGSVITEDVPPGAMGVARAKQRNVRDWVRRRRPGSAAATAAEQAQAQDEASPGNDDEDAGSGR